MIKYFIGMDCGATSTKAKLFTREFKVLSTCYEGPSNPSSVPREVGRANIVNCLRKLLNDVGIDAVDLVAISAAGTGHGRWRSYYVEPIVEGGFSSWVEVIEDYLVAHYSCFEGGPGVVLIMGTGSSVYGVGIDGVEVKVSGWGHLVDDTASAWYVGSLGIKAALNYLDFRGKYTSLLGALIEYLGINDLGDVITKIYSSRTPKALIAGFAKYVVREAREGDEVAMEILRTVSKEAAKALHAAYELINTPPKFCIVGGFYEGCKDLIKGMIEEELKYLIGNEVAIQEQVMSMEEAVIKLALKVRSE